MTLASFYIIDAPMSTKIIYAGVTYILWGTLYAISDIPFWSISSVMSSKPRERTKAVTAAVLGVNAGCACANIFFPRLTKFFAPYSTDHGYFMAVLVMMVVGMLLMLNGFFNVKERVPPGMEKVTMRDTFRNLWQNKPLFIVLCAFFAWSCTILPTAFIFTFLFIIWRMPACRPRLVPWVFLPRWPA